MVSIHRHTISTSIRTTSWSMTTLRVKNILAASEIALMICSGGKRQVPDSYHSLMSRLTRNNCLSVKPFAAVPALLDLPEILRESASVSGVSTDSCLSSTRNHIQLAEGCLITKSISYAHQVAHIINAVHEGDSAPIVSQKLPGSNCRVLRCLGAAGCHQRFADHSIP